MARARRQVEGRAASATCSTAPACRRRGKAIRFKSFDGTYTESLTLKQARRKDVIVAYKLEGDDISAEHGGPVRLYVAPMYGYKSIKWLDVIELTDKVRPGYWEHYGYDVDGWVGRSNGRRRRSHLTRRAPAPISGPRSSGGCTG